MIVGGSLIVTTGDGARRVTNLGHSSQTVGSPTSSGISSTLEGEQAQFLQGSSPVLVRRQVLLLADSMGRCIPTTDATILPVINNHAQFNTIVDDVVQGRVDVQYKNIIVWAGAQAIHQINMNDVPADLKRLVNVIRNRNPSVKLYVSALLPKPRENHLTETLMIAFNRGIKAAVNYIAQQGFSVHFLQSHKLFLDQDNQIVRPIIDSFEDGFHLNLHGAHRIRKFWLQQLGLSK